jgi:CHAT domain-containing protein
VLTSDEVSKLKLDADLVVLSGCETSIGEEAGAEGIVGFNRTFLISGARCVCGSLWPVEDSWTEKLMIAFYKGFLLRRYNKSQSIRLAKLAMLKEGANPSQWAPFVLAGSCR